MAFSLSLLEQDLSCPVCYDIYKDPVILSCTHSFCRDCLQKTWADKDERECPLCKQRCSQENLLSDRALNNTCESYIQRKREKDSRSDNMLCSVHFERLNLFCEDDEKLVCSECVSQDHQKHRFCSIGKAASAHKEKLQTDIAGLQEKLEAYSKMKNISEEMAAHIKSQAQKMERQIKNEFERLYQFLKNEEMARIIILRDEEETQSYWINYKIVQLNETINDISSKIRELEDKLTNDNLILLEINGSSERTQCTVPDLELGSEALINVECLENLKYKVWENMKDICCYFPVILDPNTANSFLTLSDDMSSISSSAEHAELPDNPERISAYHGVLGSKGFTSGTHSWDVDVGDSDDWIVGVAEASVSRKQAIVALPENGFYAISRNKDDIVALTYTEDNCFVSLMITPTIKRLHVTLEYENGQVIFSDLDNNEHLYTFTCTFTKKMYPYFNNGSTNPIKVMPARVSVKKLE